MINFKNLLETIKNSLFYEKWTCNACGKEIFSGYFCNECLKSIETIGENKCEHCGRKSMYKTEYCDSCKDRNLSFNVARSVYVYKEPLSYLIQNFKYDNAKYHLEFFANEMASVYKNEGLSCDIITFVPMHPNRLKKRAYNQAELLADALSKILNVPLVDCIEKVKDTQNQAKLSREDRVKNLVGSFKVDKNLVKDKKVLLVDDVLTTGSTVDVISKVLTSNGAKEISVLTLASVSKIVKED